MFRDKKSDKCLLGDTFGDHHLADINRPLSLRMPISGHVMLSGEFFLYVSGNYEFNFTRIYLNLKEIILKGIITWSEMGKQTNEAKEVYLTTENFRPPTYWSNHSKGERKTDLTLR